MSGLCNVSVRQLVEVYWSANRTNLDKQRAGRGLLRWRLLRVCQLQLETVKVAWLLTASVFKGDDAQRRAILCKSGCGTVLAVEVAETGADK